MYFSQADVSDWNAQLSAFKACLNSSPNDTIDLVIVAAGLIGTSFFQNQPFVSSTAQNKDPQAPDLTVLNVNLIGAYYTTCLAIHYFRTTSPPQNLDPKPTNQLVLIASNIAYHPVPFFSNYSASKAGVRAL